MEDKKEATSPCPLCPKKETGAPADESVVSQKLKDEFLEQLNIIAIKMDIHKNGMLYLKESDLMLKNLKPGLRKPVGEFLIDYIQSTKTVVLPLPTFVTALQKAANNSNSSLRKAILKCKDAFTDKEVLEITKNVGKMIDIEASPTMTLKQRIEAQKKLLKEKEKAKQIANKPKPKRAAISIRSPPKSVVKTAAPPKRTASKIVKPNTDRNRTKRQSVQDEKQVERFDSKFKPITAFNSPKGSVVERKNIMQIISQNTFKEIARRVSSKKDIRTSEEREFSQCTFNPAIKSNNKTFRHVKSKVNTPVATPKNPKKLRRAFSPDLVELPQGSITEGTFAEVYNVKTPQSLHHLLQHGYSFSFQEKKLHRRGISTSSRNMKNETEIHSRLLSQSRLGDHQRIPKSSENSVITTSSLMQDLIARERTRTVSRFMVVEEEKIPKEKCKVTINSSVREMLKKWSNPELLQLKDLHAKYITRKEKEGSKTPAGQQTGDNGINQ